MIAKLRKKIYAVPKFYGNYGNYGNYGRQDIFMSFALRPVDVKVSAQEMVLTIRRVALNHEPVAAETIESLRESIYELVGRTFPLRIVVEERKEQPDVTGTITSIDTSGRIIIQPDREGTDPLVWIGTPEDDLYIHTASDETPRNLMDLKAGLKVRAWITGEALRDTIGVHVQLRELERQ